MDEKWVDERVIAKCAGRANGREACKIRIVETFNFIEEGSRKRKNRPRLILILYIYIYIIRYFDIERDGQ